MEGDDLASFLASPVDLDNFIAAVTATADAVRAERGATKRIHLSVDEWNVWYQHRAESHPPSGDDWPVAPVLLEDRYSVADAVVVGGLLITLLRNTDRVHVATLAQLVNVIAPIMTEPGGRAWRQTTFHPFALTAEHARGEVLQIGFDDVPTTPTERFGEVPLIDAVVTYDASDGSAAVFVVNRSVEGATDVELNLAGLGDLEVVEALTLADDDPFRVATPADELAPRVNRAVTSADGVLRLELPAVSWTVVRLQG